MRSGSLFDAFNARFLEPERIGKAFIYTSQFEDVARHQHSMIVGPRGSGKTTYLKMLTMPALQHWREIGQHRFSQTINFHTIYIPSDFSWYPEFRLPIDSALSAEVDNLLTTALFRSHVLLAMCDTLQHMSRPIVGNVRYLKHLELTLSQGDWNDLTARLGYAWDITTPFGGISGLRIAVEKNIQTIQSIMVSCALNQKSAATLMEQWPMLSHFFFDDLRSFADSVTDIAGKNLNFCVCFDEIEIAPVPVRSQIVQSARSFDQRFLVKISSSPFDESDPGQTTAVGSMIGHDFHQIMLTQMRSSEILRFSRRLFTALCQEAGINNATPEGLLGPSVFSSSDEPGQTRDEERANDYAPTGRHGKRFKSLAEKDPSFQQYITKNNIDLDSIETMPEAKRAALIRKVIAPVVVRDAFLAEQTDPSSRNKVRSRKAIPEIYTGARTIFTLCEGNPRWLIGLLRPLIETYREQQGSNRERRSVPPFVQAQHIEKTLQQYLSLLSTIRAKPKSGGADSAIKLIEQIGEYFRKDTLVSDFNPDPVGSFVVDAMVSKDMEELVGRALNQGAFVILPRKNQVFQRGKIHGQRLRLTHLLSPFFQLAVVAGRPVELSRIVNEQVGADFQVDLFSLMEAKSAYQF
ncbi:ORC-CDC6 family AAA ATPase (plasmid) [Rhizobium leguminosarum]